MLDLSARHRGIVLAILHSHLPVFQVRAFGSRVDGTAKPFSDLDLLVMSADPLDASTRRHVEDAFSDSDLPFRVDVVEAARASARFLAAQGGNWELVQVPRHPAPVASASS